MGKENLPSTAALLALRAAKVAFEPRLYKYVEKGGTRASAEALGVDEHAVIKTMVMETGASSRCLLMHGDREVSTKQLARMIGVKMVQPCGPRWPSVTPAIGRRNVAVRDRKRAAGVRAADDPRSAASTSTAARAACS